MVITLNVTDPFIQQEYRTFTEGTSFTVESFSFTNTRNYRLTVSYNFSNMQAKKKESNKEALKGLMNIKT
jgi:hypothetical protein